MSTRLSNLLFTALVSFSVLSPICYGESTYSAQPGEKTEALERYSQFVLDTLLKQMGLSLPDNKKRGTPPDQKKDTHKQSSDDSNFWNDDQFFDDSKGFEEIKANFENDYENTLAQWNKEYQETVERWNKARKIYETEKETYANATYNMNEFSVNAEAPGAAPAPQRKADIDTMQPGDFYVIPHAMDISIKDQSGRGTCAAFAGVRAMEVILYQNSAMRQQHPDLSEQHFFWMSRPDCMEKPCTKENSSDGSSFDIGFLLSRKNIPQTAIMNEENCPYQTSADTGNLSYTPLRQCTFRGVARAQNFYQYLTLQQVLNEITNNRPVAAGFRLPKGFFTTKGLVTARDPANQSQSDSMHAAGHAMLLIGYIKLPQPYWASEGRYCAIMANSWGLGYGVGGHACLTEKWMQDNLIRHPKDKSRGALLTSLESVSYLN